VSLSAPIEAVKIPKIQKTKKSLDYINLPEVGCVKLSYQIAKFGHIAKVRLVF
jgi:hypothetical protein